MATKTRRTTTRTTRAARPARKPAARAATPAQAIRTLRTTARQALERGTQAATNVRESALGVVDAAVKQGTALQQKGMKLALAQARLAQKAVTSRANEARSRTVEAVSQLERVFEQRVSRVIGKLGVPSAKDVRALTKQVAQLQASVDQLRRARARA